MSGERWALVDRVDRLVADVTRLTTERDAARAEAARLREAIEAHRDSIIGISAAESGGETDRDLWDAIAPPTNSTENGTVPPSTDPPPTDQGEGA